MISYIVAPDGGVRIDSDRPLSKLESNIAVELVERLMQAQQENRVVGAAYEEIQGYPDEPPEL